ncbi:MAG: hypothetical protein ACRC3B_04845 [Bacteroidia bacterium]
MYRHDYIQRMIEEFARVLARAAGLRTQQRREDALTELHNSYQPFFGIAPELLESIAPEALTELLSAEKPLTPAQADALAQALELETTLHKGFSTPRAADCCRKALAVYSWLRTADPSTFSMVRLQAEQRLVQQLAELSETD